MAAKKGNTYASKYSIELVEKICNVVASGKNIRDTCSEMGINWDTFRRWKNDKPEVYALYIKAIQDKAEMVDSEIDDTMQDLRDGIIDPSTANVLIQTLKWKAAKYYPKMFGDRVHNNNENLNININTKLTPEEREARINELKKKLNA